MLKAIAALLILLFFFSSATPPPTWQDPTTNIHFIRIPKGAFLMGDLENKGNKSRPETPHQVTISRPFGLPLLSEVFRLGQ